MWPAPGRERWADMHRSVAPQHGKRHSHAQDRQQGENDEADRPHGRQRQGRQWAVQHLVEAGYQVLNLDTKPLDNPKVRTLITDITDAGQVYNACPATPGLPSSTRSQAAADRRGGSFRRHPAHPDRAGWRGVPHQRDGHLQRHRGRSHAGDQEDRRSPHQRRSTASSSPTTTATRLSAARRGLSGRSARFLCPVNRSTRTRRAPS